MSHDKLLSFRISSALKNIIGKDLITDKYIAVFELVKNAYDAGATLVNIGMYNLNDNPIITISDDGCGMNYNDIINKWLFVAYSEKKNKNRSNDNDYRNKLKRNVAGAKGVGRFSCDRLGSKLTLYSKSRDDVFANKLVINWDNFEVDDNNEFTKILVEYTQESSLPNGHSSGTVIEVSNLRESWDRSSILFLKKSLMKLISPNTDNYEDSFFITLTVPDEEANDNKAKSKRDVVNGLIENDVFEKLDIKTTNISVSIDTEGKTISTTLTDRGEDIFKIVETNTSYKLLKGIDISVFYLNSVAKTNFTRIMGLHAVNYGSIFVYKNGFRIYPYGNPGDDFFGMDKRKQQGYSRNLGTREVLGRISIISDGDEFVETTSRDGGFIKNNHVDMLIDFFWQKVLRVLERYVVNIIKWGEPVKTENDHVIMPHEVKDKVMTEFANISKKSDIISVEYGPLLLAKLNEKDEDSIAGAAIKLEKVAALSDNPAISTLAKQLRKKTDDLLSEHAQLESDIRVRAKELIEYKEEKEIRDKQIYFYKGATNQSVENLIAGMHSIFTLSDAVRMNVNYLQSLYNSNELADKAHFNNILVEIFQSNQKINKLAKLAIKGNKALKQVGKNSIHDFISQCFEEDLVTTRKLKYRIVSDNDRPYACAFDPASIVIIIDNVFSNALKANATEIAIYLSECEKYVNLAFRDDGVGLTSSVEPEILFDLGVTTTVDKKGFGIGLYHIKILVGEMGGFVNISKDIKNGFELVVSLLK